MDKNRYCCFIGCDETAEWEIFHECAPEGTDACNQHIGDLCGFTCGVEGDHELKHNEPFQVFWLGNRIPSDPPELVGAEAS